jgi:hypothetical protein
MQVYLLWNGYEDVMGVFSTQEKAETCRDEYITKRNNIFVRIDNFNIIEETIDAPST